MADAYTTLLQGIAARLCNGTGDNGPFASEGQVQLWVDSATDEIQPSEELTRALSGEGARAVVCDSTLEPVQSHSDGCDVIQRVNVWFGANAPTMEMAIVAQGDAKNGGYWGVCKLKDWILTRLLARNWRLSGWETLQLERCVAVRAPQPGKAMMVATFSTLRVQTQT